MKFEFSRERLEKSQVSNFIIIRPVEVELFHVDRQTDMTNLIVAFRNFAKSPKMRPKEIWY